MFAPGPCIVRLSSIRSRLVSFIFARPFAKVIGEPAQALFTAYRKVVVSVALSPLPETATGTTHCVVVTLNVSGVSPVSEAVT